MVGIGPFDEHVVHGVHFLRVYPPFVRIPRVVGSDGFPVVAHLVEVLRQDPSSDVDAYAGILQIRGTDVVRCKFGEPPIVDLHVSVVDGAVGVRVAGR